MHHHQPITLVVFLLVALVLGGCGDKATGDGAGDATNDKPARSKILVVVTSHGELSPGKPTGLWFEEFAVPFQKFHEAGFDVVVASPKGGKAPIDPRSLEQEETPDPAAIAALADTTPLASIVHKDHAAVFFPGGHGTMFDLPNDGTVQRTVTHFIEAGQPAAFVCHGPAALVGATLADGTSVVKGRKVTGFTNSEEEAVKLTKAMPFLLETKLQELGGTFSATENWKSHVVVDGNLITGQNPASSAALADALIAQLKAR